MNHESIFYHTASVQNWISFTQIGFYVVLDMTKNGNGQRKFLLKTINCSKIFSENLKMTYFAQKSNTDTIITINV